MDIKWNPDHIDLNSIIEVSRGDNEKLKKYLLQFQELIPERMNILKECLEREERKLIRQTLHQMSPQLQVFGVPEVVAPIKRLEFEYESMPFEELRNLVEKILQRLNKANQEIQNVMEIYF